MNWYIVKKSSPQMQTKENPLTYFSIGHQNYFEQLKGNKAISNCEVILWAWNPYGGLEVKPVSKSVIDHSAFGRLATHFPRGRFENCNGTKRVSVQIPQSGHFNFDQAAKFDLTEELKEQFNVSDDQIYFFN